jgi:putative protease
MVKEAATGFFVRIPLDIEVADNEAIFKTYDSKLMESLEIGTMKKIPVKMFLKANVGEPLFLLIDDGENKVVINAGIVDLAKTKPVSKSSVAEQLIKLGSTIFEAKEVNFDLDKNIFIPVSELNSIRRQAIEELEKVRVRKWKRACSKPIISFGSPKAKTKTKLSVNVCSIGSLRYAVDNGADVVYIELEKPAVHSSENKLQIKAAKRRFIALADYRKAIEYAHEKGVKVFISTPRIVKDLNEIFSSQSQQDLFEASDGFLVGNLGVLHHLQSNFVHKPIIIDYPLNIFNRLSLDFFMSFFMGFIERVTLSSELTLKEIEELTPYDPVECIVHGFFPLMVSEHDLIGGLFSGKKLDEILLKDEKGYEFPAMSDIHNRTYIMNSRELCMLDYVQDIIKSGVSCLRIEARIYDPENTGKITRDYREAIDEPGNGTKNEKHCSGAYTNGHYFRGVL